MQQRDLDVAEPVAVGALATVSTEAVRFRNLSDSPFAGSRTDSSQGPKFALSRTNVGVVLWGVETGLRGALSLFVGN